MDGKTLTAVLSAASLFLRAAAADLLVLQTGSDWCASGEDVRKTFQSEAFRAALGDGFELAVYDDMEAPSPAVKAANAKLKGRFVPTKRFPAVSCVSAGPGPARFWAQLENLPRDIAPAALAAEILDARRRRDEALALFAKGKSLKDKDPKAAAEAYGRGFALMEGRTGEFARESLRKGGLAWADEWKALSALDAGDRYGFVRGFTMGDGTDLVEKATKFRTSGDFKGGAAFIASLRRIPQDSFTADQRQCIDIAEYALWRKTPERAASNVALLEHALSLGRDTFWGQCAMGFLILSGKDLKPRARYRAPVRSRPQGGPGAVPPFPAETIERRLAGIAPGAALQEADKADIVRMEILRRIGRDGWNALWSRPGAAAFAEKFFADRMWMEDFAWSGPADWPKALPALESIVFQDGGRWISGDGAGRRCATAMALECSGRGEAWLADYFDAFRETFREGRLHLHALSQPVWQWRFALQQSHVQSHSDDPANQQRFMQKFVNMPSPAYGKAHWFVPYRGFNCFGESVHSSVYYQAWKTAGEWPLRRYSHTVGGVCGELSKFGTACSNSHGLPATTAGQPRHCAYVRLLPGGGWEIDNSADEPTDMHLRLWPSPSWSYTQAYESVFGGDRETRHDACRFAALAALAAKRPGGGAAAEAFFKRACAARPRHLDAWIAYGAWLRGTSCTLATEREWCLAAMSAMDGWRQPVWDLVTPYFARVAKEKGAAALADELAGFMPRFRQPEEKIQEEADFGKTLSAWTAPLRGSPELEAKVLAAALEAQRGTRGFLSQVLLRGCEEMMRDDARAALCMKVLSDFTAAGAGKGAKPGTLDFSALLLGASRTGNLRSFRQIAVLQDRLEPLKDAKPAYPATDFGGTLLSSGGMLRISSSCRRDTPRNYARGISAAPAQGRAFCADFEDSPWAEVVLPGAADITGVLLVDESDKGRSQTPVEIRVSEDGRNWTSVYSAEDAVAVRRVDLSARPVRARRVMVRRRPGAKRGYMQLDKFLVYGRKLY